MINTYEFTYRDVSDGIIKKAKVAATCREDAITCLETEHHQENWYFIQKL